jgi:hypothetical protein
MASDWLLFPVVLLSTVQLGETAPTPVAVPLVPKFAVLAAAFGTGGEYDDPGGLLVGYTKPHSLR